jgi:hypothetical protein
MYRLRNLFSKLSILGTLVLTSSAVASSAPCVTASLQSYIDSDLSGGCSLQDTFFRFDFTAQVLSGNPVVASASQISVTPISTSTSEGFSFSAMVGGTNYFSTPSGSVTYQINYTLDPVTTGADLDLDPPFGDVVATQSYCLNDVFPTCSHGQELAQTVSTSNPPDSLSSHIGFSILPSSLALVDVRTVVTLNGPAGFDSLNSVFTTTAAVTPTVPEPSAALLVLCGVSFVSVLAYAKRRVANRNSSC